MHSAQPYFSLPWGQGLHSAQLHLTLPCGHGVHSTHWLFCFPCGHRFRPIASRVRRYHGDYTCVRVRYRFVASIHHGCVGSLGRVVGARHESASRSVRLKRAQSNQSIFVVFDCTRPLKISSSFPRPSVSPTHIITRPGGNGRDGTDFVQNRCDVILVVVVTTRFSLDRDRARARFRVGHQRAKAFRSRIFC